MISDSMENKCEASPTKCKESLEENFSDDANEKMNKELYNTTMCNKEGCVNIDDSDILKHHLARFIVPTPQLPVLCHECNINDNGDGLSNYISPTYVNYKKMNKDSCQDNECKDNVNTGNTTTNEDNQVYNSIDIDDEEDDREYNARFIERINKFHSKINDSTSMRKNNSNTNNTLITFNGAVLSKEKPLTVKEQILLSQPYFSFTPASLSPCTRSPMMCRKEIDINLHEGDNNINNDYSNTININRNDSTEILNTNIKSNSLANDLTFSSESHATRLCEESFNVSIVNSAVDSILQTTSPECKSHDDEKCVSVNCANSTNDVIERQKSDEKNNYTAYDNNTFNHGEYKKSKDEICDANEKNNNKSEDKAERQSKQLRLGNEDEHDDTCNLSTLV